MNENKVQGTVTGITFANPDDGYTIAQLTTAENRTVCVIFNLTVKKLDSEKFCITPRVSLYGLKKMDRHKTSP
ncbi:hypothetical protein [Oscillatoria sp. HE19RPO]|uniref:YrrC family ATP-dependent DNA helicase n=1 Tax=Oscillatoria sp. HE19RPO TaxID=2954806 RepID=UPI0020C1EA74|nr:hypothetical protein [Oscillatoria sp. HE19RPO]